PVFAARLAQCAAALEPFTGWRLEDMLADADALGRVDVVQPALWAVMVSLAAVWQAAGVTPDAVVGHSQGEIAAAVVAGALSLDDAAAVVALRSRALTALAGRGAMASLALPAAEVRRRIADLGACLQLAAVNGPAASVVSGDPAAVRELVTACAADGIRARVLPVDYASHGPQVEDLEAEIRGLLDGLAPRRAAVPMISAMTGEYLDGAELDAGYWYASLRAPVEFERAVEVLAADGFRVFIESSPHPVLTVPVADILDELRQRAAVTGTPVTGTLVTGTLRRDDGGAARLLTALADAWVRGAAVDWTAVLPPAGPAELPTYAFQQQRFWPAPVTARAGIPAGGGNTGHLNTGHQNTVAESRFWAAVEDGDLPGLTSSLAVDTDQPFPAVLTALARWRRQERDDAALAGWRYRVRWEPVADVAGPALSGTWLIAVPADAPADGSAAVSAGTLAGTLAGAMRDCGAVVGLLSVDCAGDGRVELTAALEDAAAADGGPESITG
ncbi:MAG TPA: acyltransferase domain-containing protein, partial [Trebonia sp.]